MRNITVAVPDEVYQSARVYAAGNKTSVSAMATDFLFVIRHLARAEQPVPPGAAIDHHPRTVERTVNLTANSTEPA
jgi:hypothetical protein